MIPLRTLDSMLPIRAASPGDGAAALPRPHASVATSSSGFRSGLDDAERIQSERIAAASRQLVADALVMPILAQFRSSMGQFSGENSLFPVSEAEKRLGPILDAHVAESIVKRSAIPLAKRVETYLLDRAARDRDAAAGNRSKGRPDQSPQGGGSRTERDAPMPPAAPRWSTTR